MENILNNFQFSIVHFQFRKANLKKLMKGKRNGQR